MSPKHPKQRKRASLSPPDLTAIFYAFGDAQALVSVAHEVMVNANYGYGPDESVLRQGVAALERISDQLEDAERQLARFLKANGFARERGTPL